MKETQKIKWEDLGNCLSATVSLENRIKDIADLSVMFRSTDKTLGVALLIKNWDVAFYMDVPSQEEGKALALKVLSYTSKITNAKDTKQLTHYTEWNGEELRYPAEGTLYSVGEALVKKFHGKGLEIDSPYYDDERLLGVYMN